MSNALDPADFDAMALERLTFERCRSSTLVSLDPQLLSMDPAERLEFSRLQGVSLPVVQRFDRRSDLELRDSMFDEESPIERERAAWEYADRHGAGCLKEISALLDRPEERAIRTGLLWLLQKHCGPSGLSQLANYAHDKDIEVSEWARMLLDESQGRMRDASLTRRTRRDASNPFDQTLPLQIAGYARTFVPGIGWVQATLSPLWFEAILGRVMACTCEETFDSDLIIEKRLEEFHPDKSDHFEIFHFRGFSHAIDDRITHHQYESSTNHTFYPSGLVEELSKPAVEDMTVNLARTAATLRVWDPAHDTRVVHSVRGRYSGWAYVNIPRMVANGMKIGPGEIQLSSLHHKTHGRLTNTFLYGTFKGKLSDHDGDGFLDVNTSPCHATQDGSLDYSLRGSSNPDPFDPFARV